MTVIGSKDGVDGAQLAAQAVGDEHTVSGSASGEGRALPPFVEQRVCLLVHCGDTRHSDPHDNGGWGDDGDFHFDTVAEMVAMMTEHGWTPTTDGRWRCRSCSDRRECERYGHDMGSWHPAARTDTAEWRSCFRCSHFEQRLTGTQIVL